MKMLFLKKNAAEKPLSEEENALLEKIILAYTGKGGKES